jgi:Alpha/beta hydrolase domain
MRMEIQKGVVWLPDIEVPLGAHAQQNPPRSFLCALAGAYVVFPRMQADADTAHDAHRAVSDRYKTRNDYVNRVRSAARELEREGFLLADDAANPPFGRVIPVEHVSRC